MPMNAIRPMRVAVKNSENMLCSFRNGLTYDDAGCFMMKSNKFDVAQDILDSSVSCPNVLKISRDFRILDFFPIFRAKRCAKKWLEIPFTSHVFTGTFLWTTPNQHHVKFSALCDGKIRIKNIPNQFKVIHRTSI